MQTTSKNGRFRGVAGVLTRVLIALVIAGAGNLLANFVFGAHATLSDVAWGDYRASDQLDCVFVGSSYAQRGFDPVAYDEVLGSNSLNLATPGQVLGDTKTTIQMVLKEKQVKRIVLGVGIESFNLSCDPYATVPFLRACYRDDPAAYASGMFRLATDPEVITTKSSLNVLFPWTFTSVHSISGITDNVRARLTNEEFSVSAEKTVPLWHYVGKGYGNYENDSPARDTGTTVSVYGMPVVEQTCLDQLADLCDLCSENKVDLVVVVTPHPAFDLLAMGSVYPNTMKQVKAIVEEHGATYYDFSLARDGVLDLTEESFKDYEHLNLDGARSFSTTLAQLVARRDAGEDLADSFYSYDEWESWYDVHRES